MRARTLDAKTEARFMRWTARKPRFAVMGEFSAGKSTLLNFILGRNFLPTKVTATHLPAIWLSKGNDNARNLLIANDRTRRYVSAPVLDSELLAGQALLRLEIASPGLAQFDIIDTPGISDPNMPADSLALVAGFSDFVLWCTHATQAWRQSEQATWTGLPARLRKNSILVVTRADKLTSISDIDRVKRRLMRETKGLFRAIVMLSTPQAVAAHRDPNAPDYARNWAHSGGAAFVVAVNNSLLNVRERRETLLMHKRATMLPVEPARSPLGFLSRRRAPQDAPPISAPKVDVAQMPSIAATPTTKQPVDNVKHSFDMLNLWDLTVADSNALEQVAIQTDSRSHYLRSTTGFLDKLSKIEDVNPAQLEYWQRLLTLPLQENMRIDRALRQIRAEIVDFKDDVWRNLV